MSGLEGRGPKFPYEPTRAYSTARRSHCPTWPIPGSRSLSRLFGSSPPSTARSRPPRAGQRPQWRPSEKTIRRRFASFREAIQRAALT